MGLDIEYWKIIKPTKSIIEGFVEDWDNHYTLHDHYTIHGLEMSVSGKKLVKLYKDRIFTADLIPDKIKKQTRFDIKNYYYEKFKLEFPKGVFFVQKAGNIIDNDGFKKKITIAHKDFKGHNEIYYVSTQEHLKAIQNNVPNENENSFIMKLKKLPKYHFLEFWY